MVERNTFVTVANDDQLNEGYFNGIATTLGKVQLRNLIRQLQDRSVSFSADGGEWAEAYVDSNGRINSVALGVTTAVFNTDKYEVGGASEREITHSIPSGTFTSTISSCFGTFLAEDWEEGANVQYKLSNIWTGGTLNDTNTYSHNTSTYLTVATYEYGGTNSTVTADLRVSGGTGTVYANYVWVYIDRTTGSDEETTTSTSYTGVTFTNPNPSKVIAYTYLQIREASSGQVDITNIAGTFTTDGTEETSFLECNELSSFTAFTSEPTKIVVKLIPKTTSPAAGTPSIQGFGLISGRP